MTVPTVRESLNFNAAKAAKEIHDAQDKKEAFRVIISMSRRQRQMMKEAFQEAYGKDLVETLHKKFSGNAKLVVDALIDGLNSYYAKELKKATKGLGTDDTALIEIICTSKSSKLAKIHALYEKLYNTPLEKDIADDTSGEYRDVLVALVKGSREEKFLIDDEELLEDDVIDLAYVGSKTALDHGIKRFTEIFTTRNFRKMHKVLKEYRAAFGVPIEADIKKTFSGDVQKVYLAIAGVCSSITTFFAQQLYTSMKGLGTDDNTLIRVMTTRCEYDLGDIAAKFEQMYGKTLEEFIRGDTSGDYRELLLMILKGV